MTFPLLCDVILLVTMPLDLVGLHEHSAGEPRGKLSPVILCLKRSPFGDCGLLITVVHRYESSRLRPASEEKGATSMAKVNVDENPGLADRYSIRSIPTILFVKEGKVVERVIGAVPKALLQDILNARA